MRLQAAVSLLRLATVRKFSDVIGDNFILLAITIQDPCYQVRMTFVNKLLSLLSSRRLPNSYNVIPFLSCHDPETDIITLNKAYIAYNMRSMPKRMSPAPLISGRVRKLIYYIRNETRDI